MAASGRPKAKPRFDPSILNQAKSKSCDAVMEETEKAITAVEYAQASFCLEGVLFTYNAEEADRAYRSACAAIARGDFDLGMKYLQTALNKCPPQKPNAISKIKTLIAHIKQQPRKS
ncbi:uncharacterized protein LOC131041184 [Cryptomeria japonica]|uniref:uncharacterized protein LOC131041184 n=1 Tax=Cryptomeria japonica TaxID=3369 RepID=UPI0025AC542B|nr:uncharacterized protein LOC131041184 [Cryptomeria japonica]